MSIILAADIIYCERSAGILVLNFSLCNTIKADMHVHVPIFVDYMQCNIGDI